jgi:CPA2 family monovalent cation:H+ antiporter-2
MLEHAQRIGERGLIVGLTLGLIAVKCAVLLALAQVFKIRGAQRWLFALGLAQAGEFGFVLLAFTAANGVLPQALADQLLLIVALSMLLTPLLFIVYERLIAPRFAAARREADEIDEPCEIIIAGHGRFGGIVNRMLRGLGYETTVIDFSSEHLELLRRFDVQIYFGDATRPELLEAAGIARARLLVVAIDDREQITELVKFAVRNYPKLHVLSRALDRNHVYELYAAGCRDIVRETYDSSIRAGRSALEALGIANAEAMRMAAEFEAIDRKNMVALAELHELDKPNHLNPAYVAKVVENRKIMEQQLQGKAVSATEEA